MKPEVYDFGGWATKNDLRCADGRTIRKDAFKHNDGEVVPLVWNHCHNEPFNVLGHALLENREEGVYAYGFFNDTEEGKNAKQLVSHGDITRLSIYANGLTQNGTNVMHGNIREVSLVLAGANPGAKIESIISHGEYSDEEAIISTGDLLELKHAEEAPAESEKAKEEVKVADEKKEEQKSDEETVGDVIDSMTDKQKTVMYALLGEALENTEKNDENDEKDEKDMKHSVFNSSEEMSGEALAHSEEIAAAIADAKRHGSLKDSFIAHGIEDIEFLFPEAKTLTNTPEFIRRDDSWVSKVMNGAKHTPFSRIKSVFADITEDDARAKGYIKGKLKKEEVFGLLKRTTTPTTVYKKQRLDRDDIIDITDFDVVAWLKGEMRFMLEEEIARAVLIGDGRPTSSDDKINELNIRPIAMDDELYAVNVTVTEGVDEYATAKNFIRSAIKARRNYKGSGNPTLFTTEEVLSNCLLLEDNNGRVIYDTEAKLVTALRVKEIVPVEVMEGQKGPNGGDLLGIIVNMSDYTIGADKGGAVSMFDDFDIDYNAQKYLIETRCSGALTRPFSALVIETEKPETTKPSGGSNGNSTGGNT